MTTGITLIVLGIILYVIPFGISWFSFGSNEGLGIISGGLFTLLIGPACLSILGGFFLILRKLFKE